MKAFKLTMMAAMLAFASTAMAQNKVIVADDVEIEKGGQATLTVKLNYEGDETLRGWQFAIYLPDGISVLADGEGEDADYSAYCEIDADTNPKGIVNQKGLDIQPKTDGGLLYVGISKTKSEVLKQKQGTICTIELVASDTAESGVGTLKQIALTNDKNESLLLGQIDDYEFAINVGGTDGINEINAAGNEAPAYNLQGIRVNNAKGLIIRDGKKMILK